jgi:hypothetical protein
MPGTPATSPRFGAPRFSDADTASFSAQVNGVLDVLDAAVAGWSSGTYASLPAAGSSNVGKFYYATDINALFHSDGTKWRTVYGSRGSAIIPGTQSTASTSYTDLGDKVQNVLLPADGLVRVTYMATWQETIQGAALAELYFNAVPIAKTAVPSPQYITATVFTGANPPANTDAILYTTTGGLACMAGATGYTGSVTTGQAFLGGALEIFAAAGTYTVGMKFAVQTGGGTVTVKNRRLYVETIPFD